MSNRVMCKDKNKCGERSLGCPHSVWHKKTSTCEYGCVLHPKSKDKKEKKLSACS